MEQNKFYIASLLFELYHVKSLDEIIFDERVVNKMMRRELIDRKAIYKALNWAEGYEDYDYKAVLKNTPVVDELPFSNFEVYEYLMKFKKFMEKENILLND